MVVCRIIYARENPQTVAVDIVAFLPLFHLVTRLEDCACSVPQSVTLATLISYDAMVPETHFGGDKLNRISGRSRRGRGEQG